MAHESHHHHRPTHYNRAFAIGIFLNISFVIIEVIYGWLGNSMALLADAGHNFSDVLSLLLAWGAYLLATKQTTPQRTYGFRRVTIIAPLISALLLLMAMGSIAWAAIWRFNDPTPANATLVIIVATIGVVINTATALLFIKDQKHDLNIKAAYLHMAADALVSLGVVIAGLIMLVTDWAWLDPAVSLIIVAIILVGTWSLLRDSINLSIDAVPSNINITAIETYLLSLDHVVGLHDLHVWALSTTETALTAHLVVNHQLLNNGFLDQITQQLHEQFNIDHTTIQVETATANNTCRLDKPRCI